LLFLKPFGLFLPLAVRHKNFSQIPALHRLAFFGHLFRLRHIKYFVLGDRDFFGEILLHPHISPYKIHRQKQGQDHHDELQGTVQLFDPKSRFMPLHPLRDTSIKRRQHPL